MVSLSLSTRSLSPGPQPPSVCPRILHPSSEPTTLLVPLGSLDWLSGTLNDRQCPVPHHPAHSSYQTYAFNALVNSDFRGLVFSCQTLADGSCHCDYPSSLTSLGRCAVRGEDILDVSYISNSRIHDRDVTSSRWISVESTSGSMHSSCLVSALFTESCSTSFWSSRSGSSADRQWLKQGSEGKSWIVIVNTGAEP